MTITTFDATFVSLSWTPAPGVPVTNYSISYYNTDKNCFDKSDKVNVDNKTFNYILEPLEEHTEYFVEVAVIHKGRVIGSNGTTVTTNPVGMYYHG